MNFTSRNTNQKIHFIVHHPKLTLGMGILHLDMSMDYDGKYSLSLHYPNISKSSLSIDWDSPFRMFQSYADDYDMVVDELYKLVINKYGDYVFENDDTYTKARIDFYKEMQKHVEDNILTDIAKLA